MRTHSSNTQIHSLSRNKRAKTKTQWKRRVRFWQRKLYRATVNVSRGAWRLVSLYSRTVLWSRRIGYAGIRVLWWQVLSPLLCFAAVCLGVLLARPYRSTAAISTSVLAGSIGMSHGEQIVVFAVALQGAVRVFSEEAYMQWIHSSDPLLVRFLKACNAGILYYQNKPSG